MLKLKKILKEYVTGDTKVEALKGVTVNFRRSEFVSILGPSGCGKTTMLNIVGGLDRYTSGDLIINGRSTKNFTPKDWDAYRNKRIGFVFQSYNLIPHLSVLGNVELALTLAGISAEERKKKASAALEKVGLTTQLNKKPNQLSGGQMQRVAIARALVNNPDIILADEPTGALDSKTSVQIMDLLKEIAQNRLVIMVTHNDSLADSYSTRIIRLLDGDMISDSNPYSLEDAEIDEKKEKAAKEDEENRLEAIKKDNYTASLDKPNKVKEKKVKPEKKAKTSMGFITALLLSGKNMLTKKGRTFMVSFAGSIGIIGIALVLAISNGFSLYINRMQSETLSGFPITVDEYAMNSMTPEVPTGGSKNEKVLFPTDGNLNVYEQDMSKMIHLNKINQNYVDYVKGLNPDYYNDISYSYTSDFMVLTKFNDQVIKVKRSDKHSMGAAGMEMSQAFTVMGELIPNSEFVLSQYDELHGKYPTKPGEMALVVDKYNRVDKKILDNLGITSPETKTIKFEDLIGKEYRVVSADEAFVKENGTIPGTYVYNYSKDYVNLYESKNNTALTISCVLRVKESAPMSVISTGLYYLPSLTENVISSSINSVMGKTQLENKEYSYRYGMSYESLSSIMSSNVGLTLTPEYLYQSDLAYFGITKVPTKISIFPKDFEQKSKINEYLSAYNNDKSDADKILYTDASEILASTMGNMVDIISYVLIAFAGVSLVVSSIMIGIITYVSVIERTKEIGVLRSIGARKKDISRVFNAETLILGFVAGLLGVLVATILSFPINFIISLVVQANGMSAASIGNMAVVNPLHGLILIAVSMVLTFISGLIPSRIAANKDPVVALRTE